MVDSLDLFERTCLDPAFENSAIILFLNKCDLFQWKIERVNISSVPAFADYDGPDFSYDAGLDYFLKKFRARDNVHEE
eukprot:gene15362-20703_t